MGRSIPSFLRVKLRAYKGKRALDLKLRLSFSMNRGCRQFMVAEEIMKNHAGHAVRTCLASGAALLVALCGCGGPAVVAQAPGTTAAPEQHAGETTGKFYCNVGALSVEERARHSAMTKKLIAVRDAAVETPKGYEFQFTPEKVSVAELAEWVVAESKCCPFFYFHIDLEKEGRLVCLGLTGPDGVKAFIRREFAVKDRQ
jgi:hypothetical protein